MLRVVKMSEPESETSLYSETLQDILLKSIKSADYLEFKASNVNMTLVLQPQIRAEGQWNPTCGGGPVLSELFLSKSSFGAL